MCVNITKVVRVIRHFLSKFLNGISPPLKQHLTASKWGRSKQKQYSSSYKLDSQVLVYQNKPIPKIVVHLSATG